MLGPWLCTQRKVNRGSLRGLFPDRDALLQVLADSGKFAWSYSADSWDEKYASLVAYGTNHGHCNVPLSQFIDLWIDHCICLALLFLLFIVEQV